MDRHFRSFATLSALFGHAAISELSLLSGVKRKLDFEPAKGSLWRKAAVHVSTFVGRHHVRRGPTDWRNATRSGLALCLLIALCASANAAARAHPSLAALDLR